MSKATQEMSSEPPYTFGPPPPPPPTTTIHHFHYARALAPCSLLKTSTATFPLRSAMRQGALLSQPLFKQGTGVLGNAIREEKEIKVTIFRKEDSHLSTQMIPKNLQMHY